MVLDTKVDPRHSNCPLCKCKSIRVIEVVRRRPAYEVDYGIAPEKYIRHVCKCNSCDVYFNAHNLLGEDFYAGEYNAATYGDRMLERFQAIRNLPVDKSDNKNRAARVDKFLKVEKGIEKARLLDVGVGLCVFLAEMKELGNQCFALDPDWRQVQHALNCVGVDGASEGTLDTFSDPKGFDLISFNKVLEHLGDPIRELKLARRLLKDNASIYIELPDGNLALQHGNVFTRAEFVLDHLTVYSMKSVKFLVKNSGFKLRQLESIVEPSGKCTLFAFLDPVPDSFE